MHLRVLLDSVWDVDKHGNYKQGTTLKTILILFTSVLIIGNLQASPSAKSDGELLTVRTLIENGSAKYFVIDRKAFIQKTVIELVLVDIYGRSIGGYAPPFLASMTESRRLWNDFVSMDLSVPSLPEQIDVKEDRKAENESFAVGFVLDNSPSMTMPRAIRMQKAVQHALKSFDPLDYAAVVKFTSRVKNEVPVSRDKDEFLSNFKVNGINLRHDGSSIYDAAMAGIKELASVEDVSRRIMILFTDGEDNSSSASLEDVIKAAADSKVTIYGVTFGMAESAPIEAIAQSTAGKMYRLHEIYDFDRVFLGIYNALRHSYTVSVTTQPDVVDNSMQQAVMTASGGSSAVVATPQMMSMLPKGNVDLAATTTSSNVVINVDLSFSADNFTVSGADAPLIDSVATLLIQRGDIALEILNNTSETINTPEGPASLAQRRAQSVRDMLIRRGVPASRIQSYSGKGAPNSANAHSDPRKTTFIFTKM